ncbi:MAG TPA: LPS export ABC transporter ATP-binding protein [Longimicrobiales bacterium]|jgi:lipopolysaccharide export system ATP-binding protein
MTLQALRDYVLALPPRDLAVAVAVAELVRRADGNGQAERGVWLASVRDRIELLAGELGSGAMPVGGGDPEALSVYLENVVLRSLEAAGVGMREPPDESWEGVALRVESAEAGDLAPLLDELDAHVTDLARRHASERSHVSAGVAPETRDSKLWAENLTKVYRKRKVVNEVDIAVHQGEIVGLLGPNGAGKTTTFYMIVGLIPPNQGRVWLDEEELTETPMYRRARKGVGYLAQEPSIFRKLTVEDNVLSILQTLNLPKKEERARLEDLLAELSIGHLRDSKAYSLSGGERRRLEITRALVQRPKFMLLDEPFAGIDPIAVNDIQQIVKELKHRGIGVIISDHNVEQTLEIVDRAYIMYEGRIRISGSVSELVWNEDVAAIYLGPILTQRMRARFPRPDQGR